MSIVNSYQPVVCTVCEPQVGPTGDGGAMILYTHGILRYCRHGAPLWPLCPDEPRALGRESTRYGIDRYCKLYGRSVGLLPCLGHKGERDSAQRAGGSSRGCRVRGRVPTVHDTSNLRVVAGNGAFGPRGAKGKGPCMHLHASITAVATPQLGKLRPVRASSKL
jgi:hypothetical protein